jgi:hypothetical protein
MFPLPPLEEDMADIQYLLTGISSKVPKSIDDLYDELRKLALLEHKRPYDGMFRASLDSRRKKILAWIEQAESRQQLNLDDELKKVTSSIQTPYDYFAKTAQAVEDDDDDDEDDYEDDKDLPVPVEDDYEDDGEGYSEEEEIELIRAALTTSDSTCKILEKILELHDAQGMEDEEDDQVEDVFGEQDFIPNMKSGIDLRSSSSSILRRFAQSLQNHYDDLEDGGAQYGQDLEPQADEWADEQSALKDLNREEESGLRPSLDFNLAKLRKALQGSDLLERLLQEDQSGLGERRPFGVGPANVVEPRHRYDADLAAVGSSKQKFTKTSQFDPSGAFAAEDAMRDFGHEYHDDGLDEPGRRAPRVELGEILGKLKGRARRDATEMYEILKDNLMPHDEIIQELTRLYSHLIPDALASTSSKFTKKSQFDEGTLGRQHEMAMGNPTQNFGVGGDDDPMPKYDEEPEVEDESYLEALAYLGGEISDDEYIFNAHKTASEWYDGQWSGLYSFVSKRGTLYDQRIKDAAIYETERNMEQTGDETEKVKLQALKKYLESQQPENAGPIEDEEDDLGVLASIFRNTKQPIKTANDAYFENYKVEF